MSVNILYVIIITLATLIIEKLLDNLGESIFIIRKEWGELITENIDEDVPSCENRTER